MQRNSQSVAGRKFAATAMMMSITWNWNSPGRPTIVIQRQFLLVREDRCVLLADAVIPKATPDWCSGNPSSSRNKTEKSNTEFACRWRQEVAAIEEQETRELATAIDLMEGPAENAVATRPCCCRFPVPNGK